MVDRPRHDTRQARVRIDTREAREQHEIRAVSEPLDTGEVKDKIRSREVQEKCMKQRRRNMGTGLGFKDNIAHDSEPQKSFMRTTWCRHYEDRFSLWEQP